MESFGQDVSNLLVGRQILHRHAPITLKMPRQMELQGRMLGSLVEDRILCQVNG
jgi:hypothetical protein